MAKYGEGDKRWIVEERVDGANVHNWHWSETNCLQWSRTLLSQLLQNLTIIESDHILINTKTLDRLDGEAYVNVRKGKIIPGYELSLSLSWHGKIHDVNGEILLSSDGTVEIPYLSEENADEDPDLKITVNDDGPLGIRLKEAFLSKGKPIVLEKVRIYVESMAKGGPAKDDLEVKKPTTKTPSSSSQAPVASPSVPAAPAKKKKKEKEGFKTISLSERFNCGAKYVYEILMDENRWKGFTQSNAKISKEVGGEFSLFDGSVVGVNQELEEGKLIVQKWRFGSWPDGIYSTVRMALDEPQPGVTIVRLTQTGVPEEDRYGNSTVVENTERGWKELIFHKIRAVFGFGI